MPFVQYRRNKDIRQHNYNVCKFADPHRLRERQGVDKLFQNAHDKAGDGAQCKAGNHNEHAGEVDL